VLNIVATVLMPSMRLFFAVKASHVYACASSK